MTKIAEDVNCAQENRGDGETDDRPLAETRQNRVTKVELGVASAGVHGLGLSLRLY